MDQAVQAWCDFAIGRVNSDVERLSQAAATYAAIPASLPSTRNGRVLPLNAAAFCYLLADKPELAEPLFKKCIDAAPESPIFRKRFTECLVLQDKKSEALAAFADYHRLQPDRNDTRWLSPLVFKVGSAWKNLDDLAKALEIAAFNAKGRPLGEELVRWIVPWFAKMSKEGRESWWIGLHTLASPETREHIGESIWSEAAVKIR